MHGSLQDLNPNFGKSEREAGEINRRENSIGGFWGSGVGNLAGSGAIMSEIWREKKKTIEEETGGTGKSPVFWLWVPEEDIDFGIASVRSTDRRELTRDGTRTLTKGTTHTLEKWTESVERS